MEPALTVVLHIRAWVIARVVPAERMAHRLVPGAAVGDLALGERNLSRVMPGMNITAAVITANHVQIIIPHKPKV